MCSCADGFLPLKEYDQLNGEKEVPWRQCWIQDISKAVGEGRGGEAQTSKGGCQPIILAIFSPKTA